MGFKVLCGFCVEYTEKEEKEEGGGQGTAGGPRGCIMMQERERVPGPGKAVGWKGLDCGWSEAKAYERVDSVGLNLAVGIMGSPEMGSQQVRPSRQRYSALTLWSLVSCVSREVTVDA